MRLLLDTHVLLWAWFEPAQLSDKAAVAIRAGENEVLVSAVSAYEITLKFTQGKLDQAGSVVHRFDEEVSADGFSLLPLTSVHGARAGLLPYTHKDPFDRMLAAQALADGLTLVSIDEKLDLFGVNRLW